MLWCSYLKKFLSRAGLPLKDFLFLLAQTDFHSFLRSWSRHKSTEKTKRYISLVGFFLLGWAQPTACFDFKLVLEAEKFSVRRHFVLKCVLFRHLMDYMSGKKYLSIFIHICFIQIIVTKYLVNNSCYYECILQKGFQPI